MKGAERPITVRAMLAADCSTMAPELRHFVHVLAVHANNITGRGLTGQETLARYLGCSRRTVVRLWSALDAAWFAGGPVGALREARFRTSNAYTLVVRDGARLKLDRPESRCAKPGKVDVTPVAESLCQPRLVDVTSTASGCDTHGVKVPVVAPTVAHKLRSGSTEPSTEPTIGESNFSGGAAAAGASAHPSGELRSPVGRPLPPRIAAARAAAAAELARREAAKRA